MFELEIRKWETHALPLDSEPLEIRDLSYSSLHFHCLEPQLDKCLISMKNADENVLLSTWCVPNCASRLMMIKIKDQVPALTWLLI